MIKFQVTDSLGYVLREFNTYKEANGYRMTMNRFDWEINRVGIDWSRIKPY